MEECWLEYLQEGPKDDLYFASPCWAGMASKSALPSGMPEPQHLTEANGMPLGFTCIPHKIQEEQEATQTYETPASTDHMKEI